MLMMNYSLDLVLGFVQEQQLQDDCYVDFQPELDNRANEPITNKNKNKKQF